jgi:hypothetical protein
MLHNPFFYHSNWPLCTLSPSPSLLFLSFLCVSFFKAIEIICCTRKLPFTIPHVLVSYTLVWVSMNVYVWIFWHIKSMLWQALLVKRNKTGHHQAIVGMRTYSHVHRMFIFTCSYHLTYCVQRLDEMIWSFDWLLCMISHYNDKQFIEFWECHMLWYRLQYVCVYEQEHRGLRIGW